MKQEECDGAIFYTEAVRVGGLDYTVLVRAGGSISIYVPFESSHGVIFDTLDNKPPSKAAQEVINALSEKAKTASRFIEAVKSLQITIERIETESVLASREIMEAL